jgi:putative membrane protein
VLIMLVRLALRLVVLAAIIGLVANIVSGIHVDGGFWTWLWLAVLFSLVNTIVGPILRLLSLPFIILTLGLFLLVVNAALLALTAWLSDKIAIDSFGAAVAGGFLVAFFSWLAELILPLRKKDDRRAHA